MKFGVVVFPGSNCDNDMVYVLETIMGQEVVKLWHKDTDLQGCEFIVLPGGFSYGDYLRSGAIARFSPIMEKVIDFANKGGYVMGIRIVARRFITQQQSSVHLQKHLFKYSNKQHTAYAQNQKRTISFSPHCSWGGSFPCRCRNPAKLKR